MSVRSLGRRVGRPARRALRIGAALALAGAAGISLAESGPEVGGRILGTRPGYGPGATATVPNAAAIDRLIWMPGLDSGWNPQGLAYARGSLFVSAYLSRRFDRYRGPCRVFRLDPATGEETGRLDVPHPCGHAGGLAYAGTDMLYVADTRTLFAVSLDRAFAGSPPGWRTIPLGRGVDGGFAASATAAIWLGSYREERPGRVLRYATATLDALANGAPLELGLAATRSRVPSYTQGAALDRSGSLWLARSDIGWGWLERRDPATLALAARYPAPAGIEGIAFAPDGRLWAVSEAGSRHIPWRYPFFPFVFRIDPALLQSGR
jgi:hypothetical protein